jgi:His/Glu/Gln/Arg/opine family amino acid ABC transporter permease subunit
MYQWDFSPVFDNAQLFIDGLEMTVLLTVITMASSLILGLVLALARLSNVKSLSAVTGVVVEFLRDTPLLVQIYWVYAVVPVPGFAAGYLGLTLNLSAFLSEVYRSGLQSIAAGQTEAGLALGMTKAVVLRRIVIPQAVVRMIPTFGSYWISLFRDTSLVTIIGVAELTHAAQQISVDSYRPFECYTALALIYLVLTLPQARFLDWLFKRVRGEG